MVGGGFCAGLKGEWLEVFGYDCVGDYGDHEGVEGGSEDGVFFAMVNVRVVL